MTRALPYRCDAETMGVTTPPTKDGSIIMRILLPEGADLIIEKLAAAGFEAYVVGGCVRDAVRGVRPGDWDICTDALPAQVHEALEGIKVADTGVRFGTVTAVYKKKHYEITTYRTDGVYTDSRRPEDVTFIGNLRDDLSRRDFTMNAMAYSESAGLIDPFGGERDISLRLIRAVGDPARRFDEDALRIMRALRFAAILGFRIEEKTASAAVLYRDKLKNIAVERIFIELRKLIDGEHAARVIGAYSEIIETIASKPNPLGELPEGTAVRFALIFDNAAAILSGLRAPNNLISAAETIQSTPFPESRGQALRTFGELGAVSMAELLLYHRTLGRETGQAELAVVEAADKGLCCKLSQLAVNGGDLIALGLPEGDVIGKTLKTLLIKVTDGEVANNKDALIAVVRAMNY